MDQNKVALSLYEDRVSQALHTRVPTLTDEQHGKVAQLIIDMLMKKEQPSADDKYQVYHLVTVPDRENGGITAFFREYPHCISQGDDLPEAISGLSNCLHIMFEDQRYGKNSALISGADNN